MKFLWSFCNKPRLLAVAIIGNILLSGLLFSLIEGTGPITGAWWAIVTGSTTGYGDFYPKSTPGRGVAAWLMISGWFLSLVAGAQLTARMIADPDCFTDQEQREIQQQLGELCSDIRLLIGRKQ